MKPAAHTHAHSHEPHPHVHDHRGTTLTQGVARRLLSTAPALIVLWLLLVWALQ